MTNQHQTNQDELLLHAQRVIRELRNKLAARAQPSQELVAIVGMACRFPCGSGDLDAFWQATLAGANAVRNLPHDRWSEPRETPFRACFLEQPFAFDANFFGISSREATQMDPAQRLFLEVAWHALEDAGQTKRSLAGSDTAVFAGNTGVNEFLAQQLSASSEIDIYTGTGTGTDVIAGRLAYLLDLQGPCATINTACSSSLVALHLARRSLLAGECSLAIAGGVNILGPVSTTIASRMDFLAADGSCKPFDQRADGFGRGEGCGVVVLKRLSDAVAGHDRILAVLHGSAMNQDGKTNGLTAPNGRSQVSLLRRALKDAGIAASQIGYVEAHGTGTPLGDPIEVEAIAEVLGIGSSPCALGSAKGNIGHLEGAAGIAGVIRAVMVLQNEIIPPVANFNGLNPHISLEGTRLFVPSIASPWPRGMEPRYAGVSSFGWSGTNAHVILGEAPVPAGPIGTSGTVRNVIVPVSAADTASLQTLTNAVARAVVWQPAANLAAVAWSAGARRSHHAYRLAVVGDTREDIEAKLLKRASSTLQEPPPSSAPSITVFFPAVQTDSAAIVAELLDQELVFKAAVARCAREMEMAEFDPARASADERTAIFLLQFGLIEILKSWGIHATTARGEGVGSVMAALTNGSSNLSQAATSVMKSQTADPALTQAMLAEDREESDRSVIVAVGHRPSRNELLEARQVVPLLQPGHPARRSILEAMAALYEAGAEIDWDAVSGSDRRFIPMPSYPFLHKDASVSAPPVTEAPDDWFYETAWPAMPIPVPALQLGPAQATRWVVLADTADFAERLVQAISRGGDQAILIRSEESREENDAAGAVDRAFESMGPDQSVIVVHLLALDLVELDLSYKHMSRGGDDQTRASQLNPVLDNLMNLVHLFRALSERAASRNIKVWLVTRGARRLPHKARATSMAQSPVWGFAASAALEHPDLWGGIVDLDPHPSANEATLFTQHVLAQDGESRALFREGQRHVPRLRQSTPPSHTPMRINPNATYLITGAFGGIGLSLAEWLITSGAKHLVLLGRHPASTDDGPFAQWGASGVTVQCAACDVADFHKTSLLFAQIDASGHPIRGILHAAADVVWKPLIDLSHADLRASFHAKAEGSLVLDELSRTLSLDFLAFFSSAAVDLGAREGSAYAAANAFMDALALQRRDMGLPALSHQWGNWHRRTAHAQLSQQQFVQSGLHPMLPELATNALGRLLAEGADARASAKQWIVADIDRSLLQAAMAMRGQRLLFSELEWDRPSLTLAANLRTLPPLHRIETLTDLVLAQVRHTLGWTAKHPVDPLRGFFDMGFDSLKSIELKNGLSRATGLSLSSTLIMTYPNVSALTEFLHTLLFGEEHEETVTETSGETSGEMTRVTESLTDAQTHKALVEELELLRGRFDV